MAFAPANVPTGQIEIWFEFGSPYSYLSVMRIEDLAAVHGVYVAWRPFLLGPIFKDLGWESSPFLEQKEKLAYMWRDMERQCEKYALPWKQPSVFPRAAVVPLRVALACADEAWAGEFCKAVMLQNFAQDRDINSVENIERVLAALALPVAGILDLAQSAQNKLALRHQTEQARALGIFGGPTFFVEGQMFWGNDRLDDALEFAARRARP